MVAMDSRSARLSFLIVFVIAMVVVPQVSFAGRHDHDGGFFLRLSAGGGGAGTELQDVKPTTKLSGACSDVNIAIGGVVAKNLALHATLWGWAETDPELEVGSASGTLHGDLSMSAFGAGVTYYFMPVNMYLSGSVGGGVLTLELPEGEGDSDTGGAVDLTLGKEWWVGDRWGIGIAGGLGVHSIPTKVGNKDWTGASATLRFTATFN
jgi:hypothetical protein